jgi:hypothetical protein
MMHHYKVKPSVFFWRGMTIAGNPPIEKIPLTPRNYARFRAHFGTSPGVCAVCWNMIEGRLPGNFFYTHLLWALLYLKVYATESVLASKCMCDEKTFRDKVWVVLKTIDSSKCQVVSGF